MQTMNKHQNFNKAQIFFLLFNPCKTVPFMTNNFSNRTFYTYFIIITSILSPGFTFFNAFVKAIKKSSESILRASVGVFWENNIIDLVVF
jgi:hypothetical protein